MTEEERKRLLELVGAVEPNPVDVEENRYVVVFNPMRGAFSGQHIAIAELALGRVLKRPETVHHFNGKKWDNARTNLVICDSKSYHALLHKLQRPSSSPKVPKRYVREGGRKYIKHASRVNQLGELTGGDILFQEEGEIEPLIHGLTIQCDFLWEKQKPYSESAYLAKLGLRMYVNKFDYIIRRNVTR